MKILFYLFTLSFFLSGFVDLPILHNYPITQIASFPHSDTIVAIDSPNDDFEDNDFAPGLFFFALFGLAIILILVGVGIALTVLGIALLFSLISFGILSASLLIGLYKKSFLRGFQTFLLLASIIFGILFCGIAFWFLNEIVHWWAITVAIVIGTTIGLLAGILFGISSIYLLQRLTRYFKAKLN